MLPRHFHVEPPPQGLPLRGAGAFEVCQVRVGWGDSSPLCCRLRAPWGVRVAPAPGSVSFQGVWAWPRFTGSCRGHGDPRHTAGILKSNSKRSGLSGSTSQLGAPCVSWGLRCGSRPRPPSGDRSPGSSVRVPDRACVHLSPGAAWWPPTLLGQERGGVSGRLAGRPSAFASSTSTCQGGQGVPPRRAAPHLCGVAADSDVHPSLSPAAGRRASQGGARQSAPCLAPEDGPGRAVEDGRAADHACAVSGPQSPNGPGALTLLPSHVQPSL